MRGSNHLVESLDERFPGRVIGTVEHARQFASAFEQGLKSGLPDIVHLKLAPRSLSLTLVL